MPGRREEDLQNRRSGTRSEKLEIKQDVFVKHNAPDNGQFQQRPRSQGQIF